MGVDGFPTNAGRALDWLEAGLAVQPEESRAAVLVPLVSGENGPEVLFEVRAAHLKRQPNEVCLPGGHIEPGEDAREAVIREACEELLVRPAQLERIVDMGRMDGPGGMPLRVFAGSLAGYDGTFDASEVGAIFSVPVSWFLEHGPEVHRGTLVLQPPDDLPWRLIPGGRSYAWHDRVHEIPFYLGTNPVIWGFTARVLQRFTTLVKAGATKE